jgi:outer membrane protein TolC
MRRNKAPIIIYVLTLLYVSPAHAGYRQMMEEIETYRPPALTKDFSQSSGKVDETERTSAFEVEKQKIERIKSRWQQSIAASAEGPVFFRPDGRLLRSLGAAASDPRAAGEALRAGFSPATLETLALLRSPQISAAENRLRATIEAFSQVSNLDAILLQYTAFTEGINTGVGPLRGKDPVALKFPFPGVLSLKGQIADQEVNVAREDLETARRDAVSAARTAYWNLLFVHQARRITAETIDLFRDLETVATTRYESGKTNFQDVVRVRIQREILDEELITLQEKQRNLESKIREVLNLGPAVLIGTPGSTRPRQSVPKQQALYKIAHERRQELRRLRARIGKMERMIEMTESMVLPQFTLNRSLYEDEAVAKVGSAASKEPFPTSIEVQRGAGLPKMPWFGIQDAYLREIRQTLEALREDLKQAEAATIERVRSGWYEVDRARRETILYQNRIVGLSKSALDVTTRGYESGNVSFADVIASYRLWLDANLALADRQRNLGVAWADLAQVVGMTLE